MIIKVILEYLNCLVIRFKIPKMLRHKDPNVRMEVVDTLIDKTILECLSINDENAEVRSRAIKKLSTPAVLEKYAEITVKYYLQRMNDGNFSEAMFLINELEPFIGNTINFSFAMLLTSVCSGFNLDIRFTLSLGEETLINGKEIHPNDKKIHPLTKHIQQCVDHVFKLSNAGIYGTAYMRRLFAIRLSNLIYERVSNFPKVFRPPGGCGDVYYSCNMRDMRNKSVIIDSLILYVYLIEMLDPVICLQLIDKLPTVRHLYNQEKKIMDNIPRIPVVHESNFVYFNNLQTIMTSALDSIDSKWEKNDIYTISFLIQRLLSVSYDYERIAVALNHIDPQWQKTESAKTAIPDLLIGLASEKEYTRKAAIWALGQIGPEAKITIPDLIKTLGDEYIGQSVAALLDKIDPQWRSSREVKTAIKSWIYTLKNLREGKDRAARALGRCGLEAITAIPDLIKTLASEKYIRKAATWALGQIGSEAKIAIPDLIKTLTEKDTEQTKIVALALDKIDSQWHKTEAAKSVIPALVEQLFGAWSDHEIAIAILNEIPQWQKIESAKSAIPVLVEALASSGDYMRQIAITTLNKIDPQWHKTESAKSAIPVLVKALASSKDYIRQIAITTLNKIDPQWHKTESAKSAIPVLVKELDYFKNSYRLQHVAVELTAWIRILNGNSHFDL